MPIYGSLAQERHGRSLFFFSQKEAQWLFKQLQKYSPTHFAALKWQPEKQNGGYHGNPPYAARTSIQPSDSIA